MAAAAKRMAGLVLMMLAAAPAWARAAENPPADGSGWGSAEFEDDYLDGTGSGGGPSMSYFPQDLDGLNKILTRWDPDLAAIPEMDLYWGGAGWGGIGTGERFFVGLGGGGFGGSQERRRGDRLSRWSHAAGYLAVKGIYPLHRRLFLEGGLQLGGGSSSLRAERRSGRIRGSSRST